jgi:hypothetical protein
VPVRAGFNNFGVALAAVFGLLTAGLIHAGLPDMAHKAAYLVLDGIASLALAWIISSVIDADDANNGA